MADIHQTLASALDKILNGDSTKQPKNNGFVLLTFPFASKDRRRVNYVSNAERADMIVALKEIVARLEGGAEQSGRA